MSVLPVITLTALHGWGKVAIRLSAVYLDMQYFQVPVCSIYLVLNCKDWTYQPLKHKKVPLPGSAATCHELSPILLQEFWANISNFDLLKYEYFKMYQKEQQYQQFLYCLIHFCKLHWRAKSLVGWWVVEAEGTLLIQ